MFSLCRCLEAVLGTLGSVPRPEARATAFAYHALNTVSALFLICLNSFSVTAIMLYALTMWLDFFYWEAEVLPGYELFAFKIDCIYLIFLQVFDISCFDLAGSIEFPEPLLDLPQIPNLKGLCPMAWWGLMMMIPNLFIWEFPPRLNTVKALSMHYMPMMLVSGKLSRLINNSLTATFRTWPAASSDFSNPLNLFIA